MIISMVAILVLAGMDFLEMEYIVLVGLYRFSVKDMCLLIKNHAYIIIQWRI